MRLKPTTPHCHMVLQIALAVHLKLKRELPGYLDYKIKIVCEK